MKYTYVHTTNITSTLPTTHPRCSPHILLSTIMDTGDIQKRAEQVLAEAKTQAGKLQQQATELLQQAQTEASNLIGRVTSTMNGHSHATAVTGTHPNADKSVEFTGYAIMEKGGKFTKWSYNPIPLGDDDVELEITDSGICGSDMHVIDSGWGKTYYPVIVGHEIVGKVTKIGKNVTHLKVGGRGGVGAMCWSCMGKYGVTSCPDCGRGVENSCSKFTETYNAKYEDGQQTQGGYANKWRGNANFCFAIPDEISSSEAAPLLCAGVTTYSPLSRHAKAGQKVGIVGVGGLGHLAIQWANKMGCKVTAISSSESKKADCMKLGATDYLNWRDEAQLKASLRKFDVILCTATEMVREDYDRWISLLNLRGKFIMTGLPDGLTVTFNLMPLIKAQGEFIGSLIGSRAEVKEMLEFAAKHNVRPVIEKMPMSCVGEAMQRMRENKMKYRIVLQPDEIA